VETINAATPPAPAAAPAAPPSAIPQPTFANLVVKPMIELLLVWVVSLFFAWIWPSLLGLSFFIGVSLLIAGLPSLFFDWRCRVASQGLRWRQLPPKVRRRGNKRIIPMAVAFVAVFVIGMVVFPFRWIEWREESFYPKSHAYEKLVLSGNITAYQIPFWSKRLMSGSGTMALKIYRKDTTPAALTFTLPGMRLENDSHDPGQGPGVRVLTLDVLTNWLHDIVGLDVAQLQVQSEARQLMELLKPYYDAVPLSWEELNTKARTTLSSFDLSEIKSNFGEGGIFGSLFFVWLAVPGVCLSLFYSLAVRSIKRTYAEAHAEITAGCWAPPKVVPVRFPHSLLGLVLCLVLITVAFAVEGQFKGKTGALVGILLGLGILMVVALQLHARRQIHQVRAKGLWPQLGEVPTLDHVKRLAQGRENILAIKLYRQIHGVSLADAKAAVEKLAR
jgi:hypothetical protein